MKRKNIFLLIMLLLFPTMVLASDGTISNFPVAVALGMEAFVTIHMSVFVLSPLANILDPDKSKKLFIKKCHLKYNAITASTYTAGALEIVEYYKTHKNNTMPSAFTAWIYMFFYRARRKIARMLKM